MIIKTYPAYMSVEETADFLRVGKAAVYKRIRSGKIPAVRVGRPYRISTAILAELLEKATPGTF